MNRLWVRLSLAFSAVIVVVIVIIGLLPPLLIRYTMPPDFSGNPHISKTYARLADELVGFYQTHHAWDGVDLLLVGAHAALSPRQAGIVLANDEKQIIYDAGSKGTVGQTLDESEQTKALALQLDGRTIGYLGMSADEGRMPPPPPPPPPPEDQVVRMVQERLPFTEENFLLEQLLRYLVLAAVVGGPCAILLGVLMSRSLTAPLNRLAEAARAIGTRNFSRRVEVAGSAEMVEVAQAFNDMVATLERTETLRRNMIADVAHELRTPLSVLQGNLRAMLDDVYPLSKAEITGLYDQTRHLSRLVNDLHELTLAEAGQLSLNVQPVDLADLVQAAMSTFGPVAQATGITLNADVPADLPPVSADYARLTQVLYNLLANALRHTLEGGTIWLRAGQETGTAGRPPSLWLAVQDSGEGIAPEHLPHVFERFYRADPARSRDSGGAGLGLAVVRAIVENHGGQVSAASDGIPGHGSTLTVHLPLNEPSVAP